MRVSAADVKVLAFYLVLAVATTFVNKYVLTILGFTYPTIFQGWQTLVGASMLSLLHGTGSLKISFSDINRATLTPYVPIMLLYIITIYSGSVALATLSVRAFVCLHNLTHIVLLPATTYLSKQFLLQCSLAGVLLVTTVMVCYTDPQYQHTGYIWVIIHVTATGLSQLYQNAVQGKLKLGALDQVYVCYISSVSIVAPASYVLGDALAARNYKFLSLYRFYMGCICSGILGVLLNLQTIALTRDVRAELPDSLVQLMAKVAMAVICPLFFTTVVTPTHTFWVIMNLVCTAAMVTSITTETSQSLTSSEIVMDT